MKMLIEILRKLGLLDICITCFRKIGLLRIVYKVYERHMFNRLPVVKVQTEADGIRIPPPELIFEVAGTLDVEWFLCIGKSMYQSIVDLLEKNGVVIETSSAILEFGCGCGRVLRHWHGVKGPQLYGVDYNARLVRWCQKNLPFARFSRNTLYPPLAFPDEMFNCVYAISVFTHMSEELQTLWMKELGRVIKHGAFLLFTTHGESYRDKLTPEERRAFDAGNLVVRFGEVSGMNMCCAFHPVTYVQTHLPSGYTIADFIPGAQGVQDLYLIRKS
jgi:SAM-dependent methyltransferase